VVPVDLEIRKRIFDVAHMSKFSIHPDSTPTVLRCTKILKKILVVQYES
jgi:hypothetical protein